MAYLYWLKTPKGRYVGKLTSQKPVEDHTRRLWEKFTKLIQASDTDSAASTIIESDPEALGQLENNWCQHVLHKGFNTDNMFIKGAGVAEESKFAEWHKLGNFEGDNSLKDQSVFAWLQLVWNRAPYEVIEALLIMAAAKGTGQDALHNTQIDFLGRTGSATLTQNSVIKSFLSPAQFQIKIQQMSAKLPKLEETIHFESDLSLKDKSDLIEALCHPGVLPKIVDAIERARSQSTKQTKKTKKKKTKKTKKSTSKKQIKEGTEKMFRGISTTFSANDLANLSIWLSERMLEWYSTITFPTENSFQVITDLTTGYTNIISAKIRKLFVTTFDDYSTKKVVNIRTAMKTNSVFAKWPYVIKDDNWDTFYHQQLAMYYKGKYGPLVLLRQEEDGRYVFGRDNYKTEKGRNKKLFTSEEDIRPMDAQVNGDWNNVEIW